jgi:hypothetical protein
MNASDRISESTIARIAGNIASGMTAVNEPDSTLQRIAVVSVRLARMIAAEVSATDVRHPG